VLRKLTIVWLLLVLATGLSWAIGRGFGSGEHDRYASVAVLLIAFIKVRFVFLDFMELRSAPGPLRLIFEGWTIAVCSTIIGLYATGL
jgi:hypothetical protein